MRINKNSAWVGRDQNSFAGSAGLRKAGCSLLMAAVGLLAGCSGNGTGSGSSGSGGTGGGTTTPPPNYKYLTGNWEIVATSTAGTAPFSALAGFINEQATEPGVSDVTTAALQVTPTSCYDNATSVPMQGQTEDTAIKLTSFPVNGQVLTIAGTKNAAATTFTGTYAVAGGCADGATGTLTGTQYAPLTGTYSGAITGKAAETMQLNLTQYTLGTGDGVFLDSGSATFTGFSCFTKGTLAAQNGAVIGSSVTLTFDTNDSQGAQAVLTGTIDAAADTLTLTSVDVTGGSCPGSLGAATLKIAAQ